MKRYKFIAVWITDGGRKNFCNLECTRFDINENTIVLWDGDLFVGQFDRGYLELCYFTEA